MYFCPEGSDPTKDGKDCLLGVDQEDSISLHPLSDTTIKIAAPRWPITGDGGSAPVSVFFVARAQGHETFDRAVPFHLLGSHQSHRLTQRVARRRDPSHDHRPRLRRP